MSKEATMRGAAVGESFVGRLAQFFPGGMALRIPVRVTVPVPANQYLVPSTQYPENSSTRYPVLTTQKKQKQEQEQKPPHKNNGKGDGRQDLSESTVIEYGTAREVLFASALPLEFEDRIHLETADGSLTADADVVAVQYHEGKMAVAARFRSAIPNWIIKQ